MRARADERTIRSRASSIANVRLPSATRPNVEASRQVSRGPNFVARSQAYERQLLTACSRQPIERQNSGRRRPRAAASKCCNEASRSQKSARAPLVPTAAVVTAVDSQRRRLAIASALADHTHTYSVVGAGDRREGAHTQTDRRAASVNKSSICAPSCGRRPTCVVRTHTHNIEQPVVDRVHVVSQPASERRRCACSSSCCVTKRQIQQGARAREGATRRFFVGWRPEGAPRREEKAGAHCLLTRP